MGVQGLLPLLKSIQKPTHLRNFAGQTLGIDAYGWLHRGTVACAIDLAQQKPTRKHIEFTLNRVRMLIHFGVKPYLVFDGDYLPSKEHTEKERAARRKESKRVGLELLRMNRVPQAHLELQKAVDVTPLMARELIEELNRLDVPYVVAPYEADSQLAYLEKQGVISGILSEDSDLLVFGAKCLLTKLDQYGECVMIRRTDFTACREISLVGWTDKEFRMMAMLSGCDYVPGIEKMGLKTAYRLVRKHKVIDRIVRTVQFDGKMKIPAGYIESFTRAERTFLYQWVFCPESQCLVNLNAIPAELDLADMPYIGKPVKADLASGVASGDLDPNTKNKIVLPPQPRLPFTRPTVMQTPDEKQGKPISEYFKARRTPLAELDPNSFTPSPSQQRLLEAQQTAAWSASQVPASRLPTLARVASVPAPSSAPQPSRRTVSEQMMGLRGSPKRQRLCSDSILASSMDGDVGLQTATSRFFTKTEPQPSPSMRKSSSQRKQEEFDLWSDDSVADAAASLTATQEEKTTIDTASSQRKRKKLAVFMDAESGEVRSLDISQDTTTTASTTSASQALLDEGTPLTSFESTSSTSSASVFSKGVNASFAALKSEWSFQSNASKPGVTRTRSTPLTTRTPMAQKEREDLLGRLAMPVPPPSTAPRNFKAREPAETLVPRSSPPPCEVDENEVEGDDWTAEEQDREDADGPKGSEDLLVPNSPSDASDDERLRPKIDFGRFAFAG